MAEGPEGSVRGQGRSLVLAAAVELFAEKGFAEVTTREIATRAGVTEPVLFRHFGSKAALFEEAATAPFQRFIHEYLESWRTRRIAGEGDVLQLARDFYGRLYDVLVEHRELLSVVLGPPVSGSGIPGRSGHLERVLTEALAEMQAIVATESTARGAPTGTNFRIITRAVFGMVLSLALFDDTLFYDGRPSRDEVVDEIANLAASGVLDRPHDAAP